MSLQRRYLLLGHAVRPPRPLHEDPAIATKVIDDEVHVLIVPIGHDRRAPACSRHTPTNTEPGLKPDCGVSEEVVTTTSSVIRARPRKASIATIAVLCGGFIECSLRQAGCVEIYPGPARCSLGLEILSSRDRKIERPIVGHFRRPVWCGERSWRGN